MLAEKPAPFQGPTTCPVRKTPTCSPVSPWQPAATARSIGWWISGGRA